MDIPLPLHGIVHSYMVFLVNFQLEFPLPLFSTKLDTLILWVGTAKACINGSDSVERKNRNIAKQLAPYL